MPSRSTSLLLLAFALALVAVPAYALLKETKGPAAIYISEIENCAPVKALNAIRLAAEEEGRESDFMKRAFRVLFPFDSPGYNALLATFYISSAPNFILAFIPADIDLTSLNTMIAFATGGLLGDTFLNLIPHSFIGEPHPSGDIKVVVVEPRRNVLVGTAIFFGFSLFFALDKGMRYLSSLAGEDGEHSHGHSHSHTAAVESSATSTAVSNGDASTLKKRGAPEKSQAAVVEAEDTKEPGQSLKLGAYLNLFADFTHNITDGLAMAASFYASPTIGATTTLACFAHEIPHEIADYSILIKSGFTKRQAMGSQFVTAIGAFVGTFLGIWIQSISSASTSHLPDTPDLVGALLTKSTGLLGTSLQYSDLTIPIVSGSFTYVGAVMVVPEILADSKSGKQLVKELLAMAFGITCMAWLAWNE